MYYNNNVKRKVFISFHQANRREVDDFINYFAIQKGIFTPKALGVSNNDDFINSNNPEYVMRKIREKYLGDSTITIVLIGKCTHSRRYVDWEIKTSLRQGGYTPNGLIGIILPSQGRSAYLPPRLESNWAQDNTNCYARYWVYPPSAEQLVLWIEDAYRARTTRIHLIKNHAEMMKYNSVCNVCGITH